MKTSNLEVTSPEHTERKNYETIFPLPLSLSLSCSAQATGSMPERKSKVTQEGSKQKVLCLVAPSLRPGMSQGHEDCRSGGR